VTLGNPREAVFPSSRYVRNRWIYKLTRVCFFVLFFFSLDGMSGGNGRRGYRAAVTVARSASAGNSNRDRVSRRDTLTRQETVKQLGCTLCEQTCLGCGLSWKHHLTTQWMQQTALVGSECSQVYESILRELIRQSQGKMCGMCRGHVDAVSREMALQDRMDYGQVVTPSDSDSDQDQDEDDLSSYSTASDSDTEDEHQVYPYD
jgi:hypothetical protein